MLCPTDKHLSLCDKQGKEIHRKRRRFGNKFYSEESQGGPPQFFCHAEFAPIDRCLTQNATNQFYFNN